MKYLACQVLALLLFTASSLAQLIDVPPTGLAGLHCNQPEAKASCDQIVKLLYNSNIDEPALSYLVDGTFGLDTDRMMNDIATLTEGGRVLHVTFHLVSGPGQRKCRSGYSNGFAARICVKEFNKRIVFDDALKKAYQDHAARLIPVVQFALSRGAHVYLSPMLEDNLSVGIYLHMINLILPHFPPQLNLHYLRNPGHLSDGKIPPANDRIPYGFVKEKHPNSVKAVNSWYTIMTNDGTTWAVPGGAKTKMKKISLANIKKMRDATHNRGGIFILWNGESQGVYGSGRLPAAQRRYYVYTPAQEGIILNILTGGRNVTPPVTPMTPPSGDFTCTSFIDGTDGSGGFVNNPESSKKTLKIIWPGQYSDRIVEVKVWSADLSFVEVLSRATPNEYGNRQRYYGKKAIGSYPDNLTVSALLNDGNRICVVVPDPQKRLD